MIRAASGDVEISLGVSAKNDAEKTPSCLSESDRACEVKQADGFRSI